MIKQNECRANSSVAICTLFEGNYHFGLGALVNSLHANGFRGSVWAGYRGGLPPWASPMVAGQGYSELHVADGLCIRFIPVNTERHLTNHKPDFLLNLFQQYCPDAESIFYFDPDIVIKCEWSYFERWARCGIALCEDLNSPLNPTHPLRLQWHDFFASSGVRINSAHSVFVNGGFIGVARQHAEFLQEWSRILNLLAPHSGQLKTLHLGERTLLFQIPDQDALNIALYSTAIPVSVIGREGMDFIPGGYTMSHAAGAQKPWRKHNLLSALHGVPPSAADKGYWHSVSRPLSLYTPAQLIARKLDLRLGAAIGRLIRRS